MLSYIFWLLAQFFGVLLCLILVVVAFMHFKKMKKFAIYREQGVYTLPGYNKFPMGNIT